ncbi:hypothetical protein EVAR_80900_1 [Eumeta japonica]|uniref:Uncharacterized protein n=1 Tax=Eumeta variegata TaxID=151549 RepID=A0A4C1V057_EUMVA|nr:hypothetical protein EVAR_80900_1 [Eumeta japonica]
MSESSGDPFPLHHPIFLLFHNHRFPLHHLFLHLSSHFRLHQSTLFSVGYPIPSEEVDNAMVPPPGLRVRMSGGDHLLSDGSPVRLSFGYPVAITERDKSRYTEGSVSRGGVQGLARIRSGGSAEPAGIRATFSQKLDLG